MDITTMFGLIINILLFIFFFSIGYETEDDKHFSGGFMLMLSGLILIALMVQTVLLEILHAVYVVPILTIFGSYTVLMGIRKMISEHEETKEIY